MEFHGNEIQRMSKNRWTFEMSNDVKKLKVKNWAYFFKDRKAWCELVQKTKTHKGL
jgi:hypothetical protein